MSLNRWLNLLIINHYQPLSMTEPFLFCFFIDCRYNILIQIILITIEVQI